MLSQLQEVLLLRYGILLLHLNLQFIFHFTNFLLFTPASCLLLCHKPQFPNSKFQEKYLGLLAWNLCFGNFDCLLSTCFAGIKKIKKIKSQKSNFQPFCLTAGTKRSPNATAVDGISVSGESPKAIALEEHYPIAIRGSARNPCIPRGRSPNIASNPSACRST